MYQMYVYTIFPHTHVCTDTPCIYKGLRRVVLLSLVRGVWDLVTRVDHGPITKG